MAILACLHLRGCLRLIENTPVVLDPTRSGMVRKALAITTDDTKKKKLLSDYLGLKDSWLSIIIIIIIIMYCTYRYSANADSLC